MPRKNTPNEAFEQHINPFTDAIRCIAHGTLITSHERIYRLNEVYPLVLNNSDPLQLRSSPPLSLSAGQRVRIVLDDLIEDGPYRVQPVEYWSLLSTDDGREILAFHWTPEATDSRQKTYPHIHIGTALLKDSSIPPAFHKKHVPTGHVSIESIVRFAIEELGVVPLRPDWSAIRDRGQRRFDR